MDASQPRVRRRGFFLHSDTTGEPETAELENPEGFVVRLRLTRTSVPRRQVTSLARHPLPGPRHSGGRSRTDTDLEDSGPQIRSGSVTGSRQRTHSLR
jgi:hypothetical protein